MVAAGAADLTPAVRAAAREWEAEGAEEPAQATEGLEVKALMEELKGQPEEEEAGEEALRASAALEDSALEAAGDFQLVE